MSLSTINSETDKLTAGGTNHWRQYLAWYGLALLLTCALVASFNAIIDPQARLLLVDRPGLNAGKVAMATNTRKGKANALRQGNYDIIALGSSREETGLAMDHPALRDSEPYNAAIRAASMYEMRRMGEYAIQHNELDIVLLGLNFVSFNSEKSFTEDFADSPLAETVPYASLGRYLASLSTLRGSLETLRWNLGNKTLSLYGDRGEHRSAREPEAARRAFDFILSFFARVQYARYIPGDTHFQHLRAFLRELTDADVVVYAFISPVHVTHLELMAEMDLLDDYENWKRRLVQVFEEANRNLPEGQKAVLWDFSGYNEITTEKVPSPDGEKYMRWYTDSSHYNQSVGNLMLDRMFGLQSTEPVTAAPFGVRLTTDNVEAVIEAGRRDSERYRRENPDEITRLQEMLSSLP